MSSKPYIVTILPGPIFYPEIQLRARLELLSRHYRGTLITTSTTLGDVKFGNFDVRIVPFDVKQRTLSSIRLLIACVRFAMRELPTDEPNPMYVAYDPLKTGLICYLLSKITGGRLVIEVNGVYQSKKLFSSQSLTNKFRHEAFAKISRFVLQRAHGIKLLFPDQISSFNLDTSKKQIGIFPSFVDITKFQEGPSEDSVLFIGHPLHIKGVDLLLKSFVAAHPFNPHWKLKLIGWFNEKEKNFIQVFLDKYPFIECYPPVPNAEVPLHMSRCGIFVLPSRTEAMGRVLIEAMASGKPRIGSKIEGIPQVINDGVDGVLFETENEIDLTEKLIQLMSDADLRSSLGQAGLRRSKTDFSAENYIRNTYELYDKVFKNNLIVG